jgi:site-specific recombinase XerD
MGRNLIDRSQTLLIIFDESETKTHAPIEVEWPECLIDPLEEYLTTHRPLLESKHGRWYKPADDFLWLSQDGSPLTQMAIYDRIRERTKVKFGTALNPHLFRDAAATTMAIADPAHVRLAAPLLGHRTFTTTEKYYQQAKTYEAHQAYMKALFGMETEDDK